jgi:hypothetical protein
VWQQSRRCINAKRVFTSVRMPCNGLFGATRLSTIWGRRGLAAPTLQRCSGTYYGEQKNAAHSTINRYVYYLKLMLMTFSHKEQRASENAQGGCSQCVVRCSILRIAFRKHCTSTLGTVAYCSWAARHGCWCELLYCNSLLERPYSKYVLYNQVQS